MTEQAVKGQSLTDNDGFYQHTSIFEYKCKNTKTCTGSAVIYY